MSFDFLRRQLGEFITSLHPLVREIVTNVVTNQNGETLVTNQGRNAVKHQILQDIVKQTDVKVEAVLFPDLTVQ